MYKKIHLIVPRSISFILYFSLSYMGKLKCELQKRCEQTQNNLYQRYKHFSIQVTIYVILQKHSSNEHDQKMFITT